MNAKNFGVFVAECRRAQGMTQAELAVKLHVTDKAVSRWERGVGFPDIHTLEPLASALDISVLELMKSERIQSDKIAKEDAVGVVADTLDAAQSQRRRERRQALLIIGYAAIAVLLILLLDNIAWAADTLIFMSAGVGIPLFCICGSLALLCYGIQRKAAGKPWRQTVAMAAALLLLLVILLGLFFSIGALGVGPVPR